MSVDPRSTRSPRRAGPLGRLTGAVALAGLLAAGLGACGSGEDARESTPSVPQTGSASGTDGTGTTDGPDGTGSGEGEGGGEGGTEAVAVEGITVATLQAPTVLLPRPGDDGYLYVAERAGRIRRLSVEADGTLQKVDSVLLDLTDQTTTDAERGLLGMAFSADGDTIYVSHTDAEGNTRLASYAMDGTAIDASTRKVLFAVDQPFANHNGGNVVLGPGGDLWFGLGDGGSGDDPENRAQDPSTPLGKLLRIDPETGDAEIVASGLRNPWRFSFDVDDSIWIGDVGQGLWEEIDHVAFDDLAGANFGWSGLEGTHVNENVDPEGRTGEDPIPPVFEYSHDDGNCSVTGGFVYRGKAIPALVGAYLFADYCAGHVRALTLDDDGNFATEIDLGIQVPEASSFGVDQDGEAYVLSDGDTVVRIAPAS